MGLILDRYMTHTVTLERRLQDEAPEDPGWAGGESWEGADYAEPVEVVCRYERRSLNVQGGAGIAPRQADRAWFRREEGPLPEIGDKINGLVIEAVDDAYTVHGTHIGRVVRTEPGVGSGG